MEQKQWKYKIGSGKGTMIIAFIMFAAFGALTVWLHNSNNGAYIFSGLLAAVMLLVFGATLHRFLCYKVLIGKDGFYYRTGIANGRYYSYGEVEKAWISSGTAINGAQQDFCNISLSADSVIRFQFFYKDAKGINYLIKRAEAAVCANHQDITKDERTYIIDGKVYGKKKIIIGVVLLAMVVFIEAVAINITGCIYWAIPGVLVMSALFICLIVNNLCFKVRIEKDSFYLRTSPFNGRWYEYKEITCCREIKKAVRVRGTHYWEAKLPKYYFYFTFTDTSGKTHKFQFEKPIHAHEITVLCNRIESAINRKS